jgi:maltose O-acetyltransferase
MYDFIRRLLKKYWKHDQVQELVRRGLVVGTNFSMQEGVFVDYSHCWHISIGDHVTLAPYVRIIAHDASTKKFIGVTRLGKVRIGNRVFVGASSIILPGVEIGDDVIIGAGSIVTRSVRCGVVVAGNPAKVIGSTYEFLSKRRREMQGSPIFSAEYAAHEISDSMKNEMNEKMVKRYGYIV